MNLLMSVEHFVRCLSISMIYCWRKLRKLQRLTFPSRKDESSFVSMTMGVPLKDRKAKIRYWLRALVDVTCLLQNSHQLESFHALILNQEADKGPSPKPERANGSHPQIEFDKLMNSFNPDELRRLVALGRRKALLAEGVFFKNEASQLNAEPNERASSLPKKQQPTFSMAHLFYHDVSIYSSLYGIKS